MNRMGYLMIAMREGPEAYVIDQMRMARYTEAARDRLEALMDAAKLDGRERMVIEMRGAKKMDAKAVGRSLDCSARTINRIQRAAIDKMVRAQEDAET